MRLFLISIFSLIVLSGCSSDKIAHSIGSFGISAISYNYYDKNTSLDETELDTASFLTAMGFGFIKEWLDEEFDWQDILADLTGAGARQLFKVRW